MRDIAFMIPDLLNIVIPFFELKRQANKRRLSSVFQVLNKHDIFIAIASIITLWLTLLSLPWIEVHNKVAFISKQKISQMYILHCNGIL